MLTTIIFFLALLFSIFALINILEWCNDRQTNDENILKQSHNSLIFLILISCSLWSGLFHLLH
jgi:hypothetical protein